MNTTASQPGSLRPWLDQAQSQHADQPALVTAGLIERAPHLPADADGAEAIRLAEHVWLAHAGDAAGLQAFLNALPTALDQAAGTAPSLQRARLALALLAGQAGTPAADTTRWRVLQNVVLAMAAQGRSADALHLLQADEAAALAQGSSEAGKAFAATANNVAGHLQDGLRGDTARDTLMLQAAAIARRVWASAGTWLQVERADYRLALCHASAGQGAEAVAHGQRCLAACVAAGDEADAMEHFFAHEALVRAHLAAADGPAAAASRQRMQALLRDIPEADGLRDWCAQTLSNLPA